MPARRKSRHGKAARCGWQARSVPAFHSDGSSRSGSQETSRPSWWARSQCLVILPVSALQWAVRADSCASYRTDRRVLFGSRWAEAVPLARLLAIASLASFAGCLTYPMLVAVGRVRDALIVNLLSIPPALLLLFAVSFYGVEGVAASSLVSFPLQASIAWWFIRSISTSASLTCSTPVERARL